MTKDDTYTPFVQDEPLLIVISGHSAAGKDSVIQRMKSRRSPIHFVITTTTRQRREEEAHGVDYFFVSHNEFARMIEHDELLEYAIVYNDYKGVPRAQVDQALASGNDVVMRVDVQGAASIRKLYPESVLIFLTAQNEDELKRRLTERKSETPEGLDLRIAMARSELERVHEFDYLVVNADNHLDNAVDVIISIIEAEHHRMHERRDTN